MRRREFITLLGGAAAGAWTLAGRAEEAGKVYRVVHLILVPRDSISNLNEALEQGLRELGYVPGRNLALEHWSANGSLERLPEVAAEVVRSKPDVIVTGINHGIAALKKATTTIPIVMCSGSDPVEMGFVASLRRPGGNITGETSRIDPQIVAKDVGMLLQTAPNISRIALLWNTDYLANAPLAEETRVAAQQLGVTVQSVDVRKSADFDAAFSLIRQSRVGGLIVLSDPLTYFHRHQIPEFAAKSRLPSIYGLREFAELGGLMSYGVNLRELWRHAAVYIDKILKGGQSCRIAGGAAN